MKKQVKLIVIIAVVIAVLALSLWGISLIPKDETGVTSGVSQSVKLYEVEKGNVTSVKVKNEWGEYELLSDGEGGFYEESVKDFPQHTDNVNALVSFASKVTAKRMIAENCEELEKYGLSEPKITVELTDKENQTYKLSLGDEAPSGGRYFLYNDKNTVYTISLVSAEAFMYDPLDFVDVMLTETLEELYIEKIELSGTVREEPIVVVNMEESGDEDTTILFTYDIIAPGSAHLESNVVKEFLTGFSGMYAEKAFITNPTAEDLSKYGFDNPYSAVKLTTGEKVNTVTVGKIDGETAYVMRGDRDIIYKASKGSVAWLETQYPDLVSNLFLTPYIGDVKEVFVSVGGQGYTFKTEYSDATDLTVTYKGAKLDPQNFKCFYQVLVNAYLEDYSTEEPQGEPLLTLTYTYKDSKTDKLELFESKTDPRKVVVVLNGKETQFLMRYNFVEKVKGDIKNLFDGKEIITSW